MKINVTYSMVDESWLWNMRMGHLNFDNLVLRPGKSQATIVGILPNKCSKLARYCLV